MKEKFWGLKKDEVERFLKRKEREFQFEMEKLEFELNSLKKENDYLFEQINQEEKKQITLTVKDPFWQLAGTRFKAILSILNSQKETEMMLFKEAFNLKIAKYQDEISQLDKEIEEINHIINKFIHQLNNKTEKMPLDTQTKDTGTAAAEEGLEQKNSGEEEVPHLEEMNEQDSTLNELELRKDIPEVDMSTVQLKLEKKQEQYPIDTKQMVLEDEVYSGKNRIIEQIASFKEQYILGKVAGADLFDRTGKLIVAVDTKITKDVVELANANGKLAELIINMKVIGAGEE
jgi:hypothetical protein